MVQRFVHGSAPGGNGAAADHDHSAPGSGGVLALYGALADAETWAALQTFSAGIKLAAAQSIKDSGGAARYTPKATSPENKFAGDAQITGKVAIGTTIDATRSLNINPSLTLSSNYYVLAATGALRTTGNDRLIKTLWGGATHMPDGGTSGHHVFGLDFSPAVSGIDLTAGETATVTELVGLRANPQALAMYFSGAGMQLNIETMWAARFKCTATLMEFGGTGDLAVAMAYGVDVEAPGGTTGKIVDYTALRVRDTISPSGTILLAEIGPATPYLRVVGGGAPPAGLSNVHANLGGTLKQIGEGVADSGGVGYKLLRVPN